MSGVWGGGDLVVVIKNLLRQGKHHINHGYSIAGVIVGRLLYGKYIVVRASLG